MEDIKVNNTKISKAYILSFKTAKDFAEDFNQEILEGENKEKILNDVYKAVHDEAKKG